MKRALSFSILLAIVCTPAWSQVLASDQVPAVVAQAMRVKFPTVQTVEWKLKTDKNYEAEFSLKGIDYAVKFDASGKWLESEYAIPRSVVPKAVLDATAAKFKGYKITEIQRLQRWNDERPVYELHLENTKDIVKIQYGADAAILSQSSKPQPGKAK
jgi:hypothetical protein